MRQAFVHDLFVREQRPAVARDVPGATDTILYLHGLGESGLCFEGLMTDRRLAAWHHLAVDLPGYGKSPWPASPLTFEEIVSRLVDWLAKMRLSPVVVVGHSMGGVLGADLAQVAPARVRAFLNVEGNVSIEDCTFSRDASDFTLAEFLGHGRATLVDAVYQQGAEMGVGNHALRGYFASLSMADPRQLHRDSAALVRRSEAETLASETAVARAPTRYVLGDPRGTGARSRALLDQAGVPWTAIDNAGHWPYIDQHDAFVDVLVSFLATVLDAERSPIQKGVAS